MARIDQFIFNAIARARNRNYIVVYDITNDNERTIVSDTLSGIGVRVQYSVFETRLTKKQLSELEQTLRSLTITTGCIKIYRVEQQSKPIVVGTEKANNINLNDDCIII